jgi:hypothetical protein
MALPPTVALRQSIEIFNLRADRDRGAAAAGVQTALRGL